MVHILGLIGVLFFQPILVAIDIIKRSKTLLGVAESKWRPGMLTN